MTSNLRLLFKPGIVELGADCERALGLERDGKGWWPFALSLLSDVHDNYQPEHDALLERLYAAVQTEDGVYKITASKRFEALDAWLASYVADRHRNDAPVRIHDMAASNAITSLELFEKVGGLPYVHVHASDWYDRLFLVETDHGWIVVFDVMGQPLQIIGHGLVLSAYRREPWRYVVNRFVQAAAWRWIMPRAVEKFRAEGGPRLSLFHPRALLVSQNDSRFTLGRADLFAESGERWDVVRVMNALTPRHFAKDRLASGLQAVARQVAEGGLLVLGRTVDEEDGRLRATAFRQTGRRFEPLRDWSEGYELRSEVLAIELPVGENRHALQQT